MLLLASNLSWGMFTMGLLLMIVILLRRSRRYYGKSRRQSARSDQKLREPRRDSPLLDAPPETLRWQVEMQELMRDWKGELDSKMRALQALIRIANDETTRLESAIDRAERLGIAAGPDNLTAIERLADGDADLQAVVGNLPEIPLPEIPASTRGEPGGTEYRRAEIYALADRGQSADRIADRVGATVGEVELVLSLRSRSASQ